MNAESLNLDAAHRALTEHRKTFDAFSGLLIDHNRTHNLTRIDHPQEIENRHFLDSLAALTVLDENTKSQNDFSVVDAGSGAGFPGLAIAIARPQWHIVSIEATEKKVCFQQFVCDTLGLNNVEVLQGRCEVLAHQTAFRERFNAVTARAVAGLDVLAELTMAFVRPGGLGLFWKGPQVQEEIAAAIPSFEQMGAGPSHLHTYSLPDTTSVFYMVEFEKRQSTPVNRPRQNFAAIKKRPLR